MAGRAHGVGVGLQPGVGCSRCVAFRIAIRLHALSRYVGRSWYALPWLQDLPKILKLTAHVNFTHIASNCQEEELQPRSSGLSGHRSNSLPRTTLDTDVDPNELSLIGGGDGVPGATLSQRLILVENPLSLPQLPPDMLPTDLMAAGPMPAGLMHAMGSRCGVILEGVHSEGGGTGSFAEPEQAPMSPMQLRMLLLGRERGSVSMLRRSNTARASDDDEQAMSLLAARSMPEDLLQQIAPGSRSHASVRTSLQLDLMHGRAPAGDTDV